MLSTRSRRRPKTREGQSWCLRTDLRSPPTETYRRANTTRPWEVGHGSTFLLIASFRKARVVGPACIRRYPRFFSSFLGETEKRLNSVPIQKLFWSPRLGKYVRRPRQRSNVPDQVQKLQTSGRPKNFAENNCVAQTRFGCKQGRDVCLQLYPFGNWTRGRCVSFHGRFGNRGRLDR